MSSTVLPKSPQHIQSLDGLRAIAAFMVVVSHISNTVGFKPTGFGAGQIGVMIFFALSGYLMCHITDTKAFTRTNIYNFFVRRFARVVPLFLFVVTFAYLTFGATVFGATIKLYAMRDWEMFVDHLLLLKGKGVLWTIPIELFFYLLFPIFWYFNRVGWCAVIVILLMIIDVQFVGNRFDVYFSQNKGTLPIFLFLFSKIHYFLLGMLAFSWVSKFDALNLNYDLIFAVSLACVFLSYPQIVVLISGKKSALWNDVPLMMFIFVLLIATVKSNWASVTLGNRVLRYLGSTSYSLYLTHIFVLQIVTQTVGVKNPILYGAVAVFFAVLLADITHRLLERPSRTLINRQLVR